jgi:hypothetical protein
MGGGTEEPPSKAAQKAQKEILRYICKSILRLFAVKHKPVFG